MTRNARSNASRRIKRLSARLHAAALSSEERIAARMRLRGQSLRQIAAQLGVTVARASELYESAIVKAKAVA